MIEIIIKNKDFSKFQKLVNRSQLSISKVNASVEEIIENVKEKGDEAVFSYTKEFDGVSLDRLYVTEEEIENAYNSLDKNLIDALKQAKENIEKFHKKQLSSSFITNDDDGPILGQIVRPIEKVGIYVPGGTAPYPSTVLMNAVPAKIAGVKEIIMTTPPQKDGTVNPTILAAAKIAGVDKVFKVGGAQAIGALSFGTESIPKVYKIVGPGNIYVAMAKRLVYGFVDIDMIAGPSEILIIADKCANPSYVAADLLSQAEHDTLATSILITDSSDLAENVKAQITKQIEVLERKDIAIESIKNFGKIVLVDDIDEAIEISNELAPEHLEIMIEEPFTVLNKIKNAGAIFLGNYSPEPLGDYWAGPNHTLPTSGTAKFYSPLGVEDFIKRSSLIYYSRVSLESAKDAIVSIANSEGLTAHANAVKVRFEK